MILLALALAQQPVAAGAQAYSGAARQITATTPRIDATATVDGELTEEAWQRAAVLTGFTQFSPNDGTPAADSTRILVWYSATAIHFGVQAFESHGASHATLADRDGIFSDDNVQLLLGTFRDGQRVNLFAVNPLGVQGDGVITELLAQNVSNATIARQPPDLSPDYTWESRGHTTAWGYQVEVTIPFKSLRFPVGREQSWHLNVVREVQHSGYNDSWAPVQRANASFLGQTGTLAGLTDLRRGVVIDVNPEVTAKTLGAPTATGYRYDFDAVRAGGNVRWGVTNNLTLNGTVKPDFSQVESDAGQLGFDPRQALFFPEKRPFFLDGVEQFQVPNSLIYTRRIVQPDAALKLTGNVAGTNVGLLSAVDGQFASASGHDTPIINILRAQRTFGGRSTIGMAYTDRVEGSDFARLADVDGRLLLGAAYSLQFQWAQSFVRQDGASTSAPLWFTQFTANGRTYGVTGSLRGVHDDFHAGAGFNSRTGIVAATVDPRFTTYGKPGAVVQSFTGDILLNGNWQYQNFVHGGGIQDKKLHFSGNASLRGGWNVGLGMFIESFGYDSALYAGYSLELPGAGGVKDTVPFVGQPTIPNIEVFVQVGTPQWKTFNASAFGVRGNDENFFEWASGTLTYFHGEANWRPTDRARIGLSYDWQQVNRRTDGSLVNIGRIPRVSLEYQLSRAVFFRLVGQYTQRHTDSLRDDSRTGAPILISTPSGYVRAGASSSNVFQGDILLSYRPTPGTVLFAGYGGAQEEPRAFRFGGLRRTTDSFFAKFSYLFRL